MIADMQWPLQLTVKSTVEVASDIRKLVLSPVEGNVLPPFTAGAHISIKLDMPETPNETASRCYSLINSARQAGCYEIAVKRDDKGRGGSVFIHGLREGDVLFTSLPKNDFPLHGTQHEAVLLAGGIGVTPILSMLATLKQLGHSATVHYVARNKQAMAFQDEIQYLSDAKAYLYFDEGDPARGIDLDHALGAPSLHKHVYVCGPAPMIDAVIAKAKALSWSPKNVHFELFNAPAADGADSSFYVQLQRSGLRLQVAADQSILNAMLDAGLDPMFDCKRGECGVCALKVLEGKVVHRDYALSDEEHEQDQMMCICVSRAKGSELILDF